MASFVNSVLKRAKKKKPSDPSLARPPGTSKAVSHVHLLRTLHLNVTAESNLSAYVVRRSVDLISLIDYKGFSS
jgi:hypothetical protein